MKRSDRLPSFEDYSPRQTPSKHLEVFHSTELWETVKGKKDWIECTMEVKDNQVWYNLKLDDLIIVENVTDDVVFYISKRAPYMIFDIPFVGELKTFYDEYYYIGNL